MLTYFQDSIPGKKINTFGFQHTIRNQVKLSTTLLCIAVFMTSISCTRKKNIRISINLPFNEKKNIHIFNLSNGTSLYQDSLRDEILLDSLSYGIHLITLTWDRDFIDPTEFKKLRPHTINQQPHYTLQKLVFLEPDQGGKIHIYTAKGTTKEEIEQQLMDNNNSFCPLVKTDNSYAQLYETYDNIYYRYRNLFSAKRDSLNDLLYSHNDKGNIENAKIISQELKELWEKTIMPQYEEEEKQFLTKYANNIVVPFILHHRIQDQETYQSFKPIIETLPEKYQKSILIKSLSSLRSKQLLTTPGD